MVNIIQAPITKHIIKQFLPHNPTIVEAGAHIGRDTLKMSLLWPDGIIYAFEPVPTLFTQLIARTVKHNNIFCYSLALSNSIGYAPFYVSSGASTAVSSLLRPKEYSIDRPEVTFELTYVSTVTLDYWAQQNNITTIDFLWLDIQGAELQVLQASPTILWTVKALLIEASLTERFEHNPLYYELRSWIENQSFTAIQEDIPKHNKLNIFFVTNRNVPTTWR
jgi:2-O-methyltransferase